MNISELKTEASIPFNDTNVERFSVLVGTVIYLSYDPGSSSPKGWLFCNGAAVSRATYADLFEKIGTSFGAGDGSTTFNVPDLRGVFIRACPLGQSNDPEPNRAVGSFQGQAMKRLTGQTDSYQRDYSRGSYFGTQGVYYSWGYGGATDSGGGSDTCGWTDFYASRECQTGSEFRPINHSLIACIKY